MAMPMNPLSILWPAWPGESAIITIPDDPPKQDIRHRIHPPTPPPPRVKRTDPRTLPVTILNRKDKP